MQVINCIYYFSRVELYIQVTEIIFIKTIFNLFGYSFGKIVYTAIIKRYIVLPFPLIPDSIVALYKGTGSANHVGF